MLSKFLFLKFPRNSISAVQHYLNFSFSRMKKVQANFSRPKPAAEDEVSDSKKEGK